MTAAPRDGNRARSGPAGERHGAGPPDGGDPDRDARTRGLDHLTVPDVHRHVVDAARVRRHGAVEDQVARAHRVVGDLVDLAVLVARAAVDGHPCGGPGAHGQTRAVEAVRARGAVHVGFADLLLGPGDSRLSLLRRPAPRRPAPRRAPTRTVWAPARSAGRRSKDRRLSPGPSSRSANPTCTAPRARTASTARVWPCAPGPPQGWPSTAARATSTARSTRSPTTRCARAT